MDAPVSATLNAASVSLGVADGPIAPPFKHPGRDRWKARISTTPTVQVGKDASQ